MNISDAIDRIVLMGGEFTSPVFNGETYTATNTIIYHQVEVVEE